MIPVNNEDSMYKSGNFCTRGTFEHVLPKLYDILPQVFTGICKYQ